MSAGEAELLDAAAQIADRAPDELEALVGISSPSGDVDGAERALALCAELLPEDAVMERAPCSTRGSAPDMVATLSGSGSRRMMLLGHVDTVIGHDAHRPLERDGDRLYGTGTADMKGGVILALGVARELARRAEQFAELSVLLVCDEEWRVAPFVHTTRFGDYDACLCFEAGERPGEGQEGVVVRRKAAGTLKAVAYGRASHSGSAPDQGRNALLALAAVAQSVAELHDPAGPEQLSVVPTVLHAGTAFNIVPAYGELIFDLRARRLEAFEPILDRIEGQRDGVSLEPRMERKWPGMDSTQRTEQLLREASARLGRQIVGTARGGASDASHFAAHIPLTVDGLGPRGGGAHTPEEFVLSESLGQRAEVALALAAQILAGS